MRSKKKLSIMHKSLFRLVLNTLYSKKRKIPFIYTRSSTISDLLVNKEIYIYNGMSFKKIILGKRLVNMKFGEFSFTKRRGKLIHKIENKKIRTKR